MVRLIRMKQPCCPGMNNSYGAHIHLSTRQIWGEGPGREMKPRLVRPKGQGQGTGLEARVEWKASWWSSCRVGGPFVRSRAGGWSAALLWLGPKA